MVTVEEIMWEIKARLFDAMADAIINNKIDGETLDEWVANSSGTLNVTEQVLRQYLN